MLWNGHDGFGITAITTLYFEFYELIAMCKAGELGYMQDMLESYWGGMLRLGATTIWEQFDPHKTGAQHYAMYGQGNGGTSAVIDWEKCSRD